ncbi:hypothetical protein [Aquimarina sp. RZ0]|uniref:hypothetical protein n=1 Tax=Aquimarina sp. RZ0 TaxID=2607730 RepID=UPI00165ECE98|nr:hypothetical protein [Aquimarina sp. RZ0]
MKRLFLPLALISFSIICLSIVHIDNMNKLDIESKKLKKNYKTNSLTDAEIAENQSNI